MASDIKLKAYASTGASLMTTDLNSLASGSYVLSSAVTAGDVASGVVANGTNLYTHADFELVVTFGTGPTAGTAVVLFIIPIVDGSNYATSGTPQPELAVGQWTVQSNTSLQRLAILRVPLPPTNFKVSVYNGTNQAFPASGSTIKYSPYYQNQVV